MPRPSSAWPSSAIASVLAVMADSGSSAASPTGIDGKMLDPPHQLLDALDDMFRFCCSRGSSIQLNITLAGKLGNKSGPVPLPVIGDDL